MYSHYITITYTYIYPIILGLYDVSAKPQRNYRIRAPVQTVRVQNADCDTAADCPAQHYCVSAAVFSDDPFLDNDKCMHKDEIPSYAKPLIGFSDVILFFCYSKKY